MQEDFNDFPEDDLFASVQDTGEPDCEKWKKNVANAQKKVNKEGRELQAKIIEIRKELNIFKRDQARNCNRKCETGKHFLKVKYCIFDQW